MAMYLPMVIDRIHMNVVIPSKALHSFLWDQLYEMKALQKELIPNGKLKLWAAAGFMDTLLRCEDETGGGLWKREGNLAESSKLKRSSWLRSAV